MKSFENNSFGVERIREPVCRYILKICGDKIFVFFGIIFKNDSYICEKYLNHAIS